MTHRPQSPHNRVTKANHMIFLFRLERCCDCDYITVYDGPSVYYSQLGQLCYNSSLDTFHSSSNHMTVLFKSDSSVGRRGFRAEFISSLPTDKGE